MELNERIYRADQARAVLENEAFQRAFSDIKQEITTQWTQSPVRDVEGREKLYSLLRLADKLELTLKASLTDGKLAAEEMTRRQTLLEKGKELIGIS